MIRSELLSDIFLIYSLENLQILLLAYKHLRNIFLLYIGNINKSIQSEDISEVIFTVNVLPD